jgi:hypothetical protein
MERFGRSRFGFGGVDLRVLFIPSCPGYTGLTGGLDRCEPFVGFASSELLDSCVFGSWCFWSVLGLFGVVLLGRLCVGFSFRAGCVLGVFLFPGLGVTEAFWNACCAAAVATGLTGTAYRSDRCHRSDRRKFPLCVLVCFGSEGCLFVPRSSSTPVAVWAWTTWVVSRRRVLEVVFVLLESPSPSRRIFISSHSLPPPLVRRIGPSIGIRAGYGS